MGYFVEIWRFLKDYLRLNLHPFKISLRKLDWGIDFVGYVARPHYGIPRHGTALRMLNNIQRIDNPEILEGVLNSYLGYLGHVYSTKIQDELRSRAYETATRLQEMY